MKKFLNYILPPNTKRRLFAKGVSFIFKHPVFVLKQIKKGNIIKIIKIIKIFKTNPSYLSNRMNSYFENMSKNNLSFYISEMKKYKTIIVATAKKPVVSILIAAHNNFYYTYNCVISIMKNTDFQILPYEIIIVDDCSTDETSKCEYYIKGVKIIHNKTNLGFLLSVNSGADACIGDYIYLLNNDTCIQKNAIKELVDVFKHNDKVGIVGSKLIYKNGLLQEAGGIVWNDANAMNYGNGDNPFSYEYNYVKEVDYVSGASLLIKREIFDKVGKFDITFAPAYYEDTDLCFKVREYGLKVYYSPNSVVLHFEGVSNGKNLNTGIKKYQEINKNKFYNKWKNILKDYPAQLTNIFKARDRSINKKSILFVDRFVPTFDQDCGSKCVYSYMKLFSHLGFKVSFLGDDYLATEPYTTILQNQGFEILHGNKIKTSLNDYLTKQAQFDYVFLNRPDITIKYIDFISKYTKTKIIYFGHDLHPLRLKRQYDLTKDKSILNAIKKYEAMEKFIFDRSDLIYYPSTVETALVKKINQNYNAKTLQLYMYNKEAVSHVNNNSADLLFVGGFAHMPNHDACIWFAKEIFPIIKKSVPDATFHIVGSNPNIELTNLNDNKNIFVHGYVSDQELSKIYQQCTIFVGPLRFGAGVKGKILEAMYNSLPVVTTSCGAEGIINDCNALTIADNPTELSKCIIQLLNNSKKRLDKIIASKNTINKFYSIENATKMILHDLSEI